MNMNTKVLAALALLGALAAALGAMLFGTRFAAFLNLEQQRHHTLPEKERRQRNLSGAAALLCLAALFGLVWLAVRLFGM